MILRKAILIACSVAALSAAAFVCVIALAFALYAALQPLWGSALAAAGVAGACVLLALVVGFGALLAAKPPRPKTAPANDDMSSKLFTLAREKPIVAAAAILGAAIVAWKNPKLTALALGGFMAAKPADKSKK